MRIMISAGGSASDYFAHTGNENHPTSFFAVNSVIFALAPSLCSAHRRSDSRPSESRLSDSRLSDSRLLRVAGLRVAGLRVAGLRVAGLRLAQALRAGVLSARGDGGVTASTV